MITTCANCDRPLDAAEACVLTLHQAGVPVLRFRCCSPACRTHIEWDWAVGAPNFEEVY